MEMAGASVSTSDFIKRLDGPLEDGTDVAWTKRGEEQFRQKPGPNPSPPPNKQTNKQQQLLKNNNNNESDFSWKTWVPSEAVRAGLSCIFPHFNALSSQAKYGRSSLTNHKIRWEQLEKNKREFYFLLRRA